MKTSVTLFISLKIVEKIAKETSRKALNGRESHAGVQSKVFNYEKFKLDNCNWTPT